MSRPEDLLAQVTRSGLGLLSRTRLPKVEGELRLAGLHAPVEAFRDEWGVPHIYSQNAHDMFFAQGFLHAQDRLWQMEFIRRMVSGRLAEVLGGVAVPLDRWMRTLTMRRVAEFEVSLLDETPRAHLQAYANGINACLARGRFPIEFSLLRYRPEVWTIADTLSWVKMMSWTLSVNWEAELLRSQIVARLGPELAAELEPPHLSRWPYVVHPGTDFSHIGPAALQRAQSLRPFTGPSPYEGIGSNNWAVSGERTESGSPIFANDMHLGLTAPAIWYENHLACPEMEVIGVTFPGVPGIVSGHNGHVAWGFTNGFPDVQDLYMERLRRTESGGVQVEHNGEWEDARLIREVIHVKGEPAVSEEVIITRHGPIINALAPDFAGEQPLALRWTSLEPDTMTHAIFAMLAARDCTEFHEALRNWTAPVQNVVYADTTGSIAYTFPGRIPLRARGSGRLPSPGWTDDYEWTGYIPFEALPHLVDPEQGYIASANNRVIGDDYPIRIDLEPIAGDRAQRICELILDPVNRGGREKIAIDDVRSMHYDLVSPSARLVSRYLNGLAARDSAHTPETGVQAALKLFTGWEGGLSPDSPAAALYQSFTRQMVRIMLSARLDDPPKNRAKKRRATPETTLTDRFLGKGPTPVLAELGLFGERWLPWLTNLLPDPDSHWFDLGGGETRDDVMLLALKSAVDELTGLLGPDQRLWSWGRLHQVTFRHALGASPMLAALFNVGPRPIGGDQTTVCATGASYYSLDTAGMVAAPYRMIIDLGNLDNSISQLAPGQSGHPASPHYADQVDSWMTGGYHPMLFSRDSVSRHTRHTLRMAP